MAIENWIDELAKVWEISDGAGGTVKSYRLFETNEFPESLSDFPCAITYPLSANVQYSVGQGAVTLWDGVTEFHLKPNVNKSNFPELLRYFVRIRNAAAAHINLINSRGERVAHFILQPEGASIQGPVEMQYGEEAPHHGLVVRWQVKELEAVTIAAA